MNDNNNKLLLIEDDPIVRESLSMYLEECGYDIVEAEDGEMGLARFSVEKPDLVISDLKMPHLDGLTVLEALSEFNSDTPFIVVSGAGKMQEAVKALRLGAHDYFVKPIADLELLECSIERALEQRKLRAQNERYAKELERKNEQIEQSLAVLKRDQSAAHQVQQAMLPKREITYSGVEFDYLWRPSLFVSGDFIDYFEVSDRFTLFYLVDVAGHGVPAAFITVFLKQLSHSLIKDYESTSNRRSFASPGSIIEMINERLMAANLDKHATMVLAVYDKKKSRLRYSVAGHLPRPILKMMEGSSQYLDKGGLAIGLMDDVSWGSSEVTLRPGDEIILCSDGVFELMENGKTTANEQKLLDLIAQSQTVDEISSALGLNATRELNDDIAVLKFRVSTQHG